MGICDIGRGVCVALIAFLYFMGWLEVWHLFVITFLNSSFEGFRSPSQSSIFPKILKEENMDKFLETVDAYALEVSDPVNLLACAVFDRMTDISAAIGLAQLNRIDEFYLFYVILL